MHECTLFGTLFGKLTLKDNIFLKHLTYCNLYFKKFPNAVSNNGPSRPPAPTYATPTGRAQPIAVPAIPLEEMKEITKNFSNDALIGEGSYARVYFGVLKDGTKSAVKKLDSSKQPDQEFLVQVLVPFLYPQIIYFLIQKPQFSIPFLLQVSAVSRLKHENVLQLVGFCAEGNIRVLAYEYATRGSLHDILHGMENKPSIYFHKLYFIVIAYANSTHVTLHYTFIND